MARLFVGQREIQFINDIAKEVIKDVIGQTIQYYPLSTIKSTVHPVYNEAIKKVFDNPIRMNVLVGQPEWSSRTTGFGPDQEAKLEVLVQYKDLVDKGFYPSEGDMFSYGDVLFEVLTFTNMNNIFGLEEYDNAWKITARSARLSHFDPNSLPIPTKDAAGGAQTVFEQQRGLAVTSTGEATGDVRELRQRLGHQMPDVALGTGARRVEPGNDAAPSGDFIQEDAASSFNNDPLPPKKGIYDE